MKLRARGCLLDGYWAFGRRWPRDHTVDVDLSEAEAALVLADANIVAIEIPDSAPRIATPIVPLPARK